MLGVSPSFPGNCSGFKRFDERFNFVFMESKIETESKKRGVKKAPFKSQPDFVGAMPDFGSLIS